MQYCCFVNLQCTPITHISNETARQLLTRQFMYAINICYIKPFNNWLGNMLTILSSKYITEGVRNALKMEDVTTYEDSNQ